MPRPLNEDALTPAGEVIRAWCHAHGVSMNQLNNRLGWRSGRIYEVARAEAMLHADVVAICRETGIPRERFDGLDERRGK